MKKYLKYILIAVLVTGGMISLFPRGAHAGDPSQSDQGNYAVASHTLEAQATESSQQGLLKSQPLPNALTWSNERQNLIGKLGIEGQKGLVGYVALIGNQGQLVAYYTIQGKVSSLNSYLTTTQQVVDHLGVNGNTSVTVDSPDLDGSYGVNPSGIFFFTTAGTYVEWSGMYLYSNQPLSYVQAPLLVETQKK